MVIGNSAIFTTRTFVESLQSGAFIMDHMPDHEVHPSPSPNAYECKRFVFGDRWRFGIECEVQDCEFDPWGSREPYGSLWLWIDGQVIGNTAQAEQLIHAFAPLQSAINSPGQREAATVPGTSNLDKLDFIAWVRFGEDEDFNSERWGPGDIEQLRRFQVEPFKVWPRGYSPFHDGWEAVLLEHEEHETVVWRHWCGEAAKTHEVSFPRGEVTRVIGLANEWFCPLQRNRTGTEGQSG
jgi:hypothetical protein